MRLGQEFQKSGSRAGRLGRDNNGGDEFFGFERGFIIIDKKVAQRNFPLTVARLDSNPRVQDEQRRRWVLVGVCMCQRAANGGSRPNTDAGYMLEGRSQKGKTVLNQG